MNYICTPKTLVLENGMCQMEKLGRCSSVLQGKIIACGWWSSQVNVCQERVGSLATSPQDGSEETDCRPVEPPQSIRHAACGFALHTLALTLVGEMMLPFAPALGLVASSERWECHVRAGSRHKDNPPKDDEAHGIVNTEWWPSAITTRALKPSYEVHPQYKRNARIKFRWSLLLCLVYYYYT